MRAECTWGEGPDVMVVLDGTPMMAYENPINVSDGIGCFESIPKDDDELCWCTHGFIRQGSFDLTAQEALTLAESLTSAAKISIEMDLSLRRML